MQNDSSVVNLISSEALKVFISSNGAEILGLFVDGNEHNWIWSAKDPWQRSAPVLFPIVGKLRNNSLDHKNGKLSLSQHGFARDKQFKPELISKNRIRYQLQSDGRLLQQYPFEFSLVIDYEIVGTTLLVKYRVENLSDDLMYFNLGWHPGFVLPDQSNFPLHLFSSKGFHKRFLLENGLIDLNSIVDLKGARSAKILANSFITDAWIFIDSYLNEVSISNSFFDRIVIKSSAPHWGIWSNEPKKFICIEPWWGFADILGASSVLSEKRGIQVLLPGDSWTSEVSVEIIPGNHVVESGRSTI